MSTGVDEGIHCLQFQGRKMTNYQITKRSDVVGSAGSTMLCLARLMWQDNADDPRPDDPRQRGI